MAVPRGRIRQALRGLRGEETGIRGLRILIGVLLAVALGSVVRSAWEGLPSPEITIEACSFLAALLIVLVDHGAERRALRRRAIENVVRELIANASELTSGELMRTADQLREAMNDEADGLRYYYSHLATIATRGAVLGGALDGRQDRELVERLSRWVHECEACNRRFMMSELRLFATSSDEASVQERARIHVSIVVGPATHQRTGLKKVASYLVQAKEKGGLPKQLASMVGDLQGAVEQFRNADAISSELQQQFGLSGSASAST